MTINRVCVTGGGGFVGSHMVRRLLDEGCKVHVVDNFRTGRREFLPTKDSENMYREGPGFVYGSFGTTKVAHPDCTVFEGDILNFELLLAAIDGCDWVVHLAANPDARGERRGVQFNLDQNINGTHSVLEAMRHVGTDRILYASSASIYGNTTENPVPEDFRMVSQASFYGASKLAAEGLIGAYTEMYGLTAVLGRWVHILGERYLHGHIIDFIRRLRRDPSHLHILGDGQQAKSGLHAADLADGLWTTMQHHDLDTGCHAYNYGGDTLLTVQQSAELICRTMGVSPTVTFAGPAHGGGGWIGDNPRLVLDSTKARSLGWAPTMSVPDAIQLTTEWLLSDQCRYL